jgi:hypothetical protein
MVERREELQRSNQEVHERMLGDRSTSSDRGS